MHVAGGNFIPGTIDHFGGSAHAEYGPLLFTVYPGPGFTPVRETNNFNGGDQPNVCPVSGSSTAPSGRSRR
jgi:hypothetical protein